MTRPNTHVGNTQGPSPQEQLDKYMMTDGAPVIWRNQWQAILDGSSGYVPQSCATGVGLVESEAYVERIFSLCGMLTAEDEIG